ncbi:hypothetical protein [Actinoallomurus acaciae]|uniref:Uncharacterized protein n=1 Tax=Actinoallomurus acaciae TaxID=502577 RepID=A0ABV5Z0B4_9ACTN
MRAVVVSVFAVARRVFGPPARLGYRFARAVGVVVVVTLVRPVAGSMLRSGLG